MTGRPVHFLSPAIAAAFLAMTLPAACTPLPDLEFDARDAEPDAEAAAPLEGGMADAPRADADADSDADVLGCPAVPPPGATCCGEKACVGCVAANCADCSAANCAAGDVCCLRGPNVQCRAPANCK